MTSEMHESEDSQRPETSRPPKDVTWDVLGVGASSIDSVYVLPETPVPDSPTAKLRISRQVTSPGGQTATVMATCASLGLHTQFVGTVGSDTNAATILEALRAQGVDTSSVIVRQAPSPYAVILIDERHGERIVLWHRDPAAALTASDLTALDVTTARLVHVDDVDVEAALFAAQAARRHGVPVTSDIEQAATARAMIDAVDVAILAEQVPAALVPGEAIDAALHRLQARPDQMVCATLGGRGALLLAGGEIYDVRGHAVDVVDTTGAGDVFRGAFIAALLRGDAPADVLRFANAAAALSCTRLGAIGGVPTEAEVRALLAR
jgi:sugar/nucleoside kinase (ribokinase family)